MKNKLCIPWSSATWLVLLLVVVGCDVINPEETLPTTLLVEPFQFESLPGQGTADNKISEVWVFAKGSLLGVYTPPVNVYYLGTGPTTFTFRPGIRNNGIANDAIIYPMFTGDTFNLEASPGTNYTITPQIGYVPGTVFGFMADFELDNPFTDNRDTVTASQLVRSATDVYEGQFAGEIIMSEEAFLIEVGHVVPISGLRSDGTPSYLEFRYKSEVEMSIGLLGINLDGQSASYFFYLVNPSPEWNMLYIELTDQIAISGFDSYKILFRSLYPTTATAPEHHIFLDNIKVVYQQE